MGDKLRNLRPTIAMWTFATVASILTGCALDAPSGICALRSDEIRVFPLEGTTEVPPNVVVRILLSERNAPEIDPFLVDNFDGTTIPATVLEIPTKFGTVLEVVSDFELPPNSTIAIELVDRVTNDVVGVSVFETGVFSETGPPTAEGPVVIGAIPASDRQCCGADGCRDGTAVSTPSVLGNIPGPQLVLLDVEEVSATACGSSARLVDVIPVVQEGNAGNGLDAETDRTLSGCFQVTVRDQYGRIGQPDGVVCTEGFVFEPGSGQNCNSRSGCEGAPNSPLPTVILGAMLIAFGWRRRRSC